MPKLFLEYLIAISVEAPNFLHLRDLKNNIPVGIIVLALYSQSQVVLRYPEKKRDRAIAVTLELVSPFFLFIPDRKCERFDWFKSRIYDTFRFLRNVSGFERSSLRGSDLVLERVDLLTHLPPAPAGSDFTHVSRARDRAGCPGPAPESPSLVPLEFCWTTVLNFAVRPETFLFCLPDRYSLPGRSRRDQSPALKEIKG